MNVKAAGGITAKVIADSISHDVRLTTLQLRYPRFIHSEFMTHRLFSRNASSSRAIPVETMIKQVRYDPAMPIHWGKNKPGMSADESVSDQDMAKNLWLGASDDAIVVAEAMAYEENLHKQVVNRILEPYQFINVIVTATEWDNFFTLRLHTDAQPEIQSLATCMKVAMNSSEPRELKAGEWHLPYVSKYDYDGNPSYYDNPADAIKCSVARCARVSYLNHDKSDPDVNKDVALSNKLLEAKHMSPFEHVATPMKYSKDIFSDFGQTHIDRNGWIWSGNFRGWIQYRQIL